MELWGENVSELFPERGKEQSVLGLRRNNKVSALGGRLDVSNNLHVLSLQKASIQDLILINDPGPKLMGFIENRMNVLCIEIKDLHRDQTLCIVPSIFCVMRE